ncbi:hypothetical protein N0V88_005358 [Collariella sp. IMI 366227]|nr:hypothetical protein N0V88_005358 [Collariella sp. IMI 366227]
MSSKRHTILPRFLRPQTPIHFSSSITIADSALLTGTHLIAIHSESVVHPRAKLDSLAGRINIGRRCIIHERAALGAVGTSGRITEAAVTLGDYVTIEVAATIEAGETVIGDGTVNCTLAPHTEIAPGDVVPDFTVVYSNGMRRTDRRGAVELRHKGQARQIEVLRRMIPSNPAKFA